MTAVATQSTLWGRVFDVERYATHDGPGIRTTLFLKGCPLRCLWCHNPEAESPRFELMYDEGRCIGCLACFSACEEGALWLADRAGRRIPPEELAFFRDYPEQIGSRCYQPERCQRCGRCAETCFSGALEMVGRELTVEEAYAELECDRPFYEHSGGGVTLSGGEPLAQHLFVRELLAMCRAGGLHTALDTAACSRWPILESVLQYTDLVLLDLKVMDPARHREYTGVDNALILENARALAAFMAGRAASAAWPWGHTGAWVRVPLIPTLNDDEENLRKTAAFVREEMGGAVRRVELLGYHRLGVAKLRRLRRESHLPGVQPPSKARLAELAGWIREELEGTGIRVEAR
jgi:pyruvate formate lyase activating enzyme